MLRPYTGMVARRVPKVFFVGLEAVSQKGLRIVDAFLIALFFVFIAELGDKTQLVALAFATRYRATIVMAAVFAATLLVHLFSVLIGEVLGLTLPVFWIKL